MRKRNTSHRQSNLGKALQYFTNHQVALGRFLDYGFVPPDNGIVERLHGGPDRKVPLRGPDSGGERAAVAYTILGACRLAGVEDPIEYLADVLPKLTRRIRLLDRRRSCRRAGRRRERLPWGWLMTAEDEWTVDGERVTDAQVLLRLKLVIENESDLIVEHRFYRGASAPHRFVCSDFAALKTYLEMKTKPGDHFFFWRFEDCCRDDNFADRGKVPILPVAYPRAARTDAPACHDQRRAIKGPIPARSTGRSRT